MARKMVSVDAEKESAPGLLTNSTEYATNHPQKINWKKAKTCVRSFVKSHRKVLREACRG